MSTSLLELNAGLAIATSWFQSLICSQIEVAYLLEDTVKVLIIPSTPVFSSIWTLLACLIDVSNAVVVNALKLNCNST